MTGKPECDQFLDQYIDDRLSEPAAKHLSGCLDCQELRTSLQTIKSQGSLLEPAHALLQKKISQSVAAHSQASIPLIDSLITLLTGLRKPQFALAVLVLLALPGVIYYLHSPGAIPVLPLKTPDTLTAPWVSLASRSEIFNDGKGTTIANSGPAVVKFHPMELDVKSGEIISTIEPGSYPLFKIRTPHGSVQVVGTIFHTTVTAADTVVKVIRGKVLVSPKIGPVKTIVAGESASMVSFSDPKSPSSTQILAPGEDVTQSSR